MMSIKKGNRFSATYSNQTYEVVGKWNGNLVMASTAPGSDVFLQVGNPQECKGKSPVGGGEKCLMH